MSDEISYGARVAVDNLRHLADANKKGLLEVSSSSTSTPHIFKQEYVDNRKLRAYGTVERPPAGHQGSGNWIIVHDDGSRAVYNVSEIVRVEDIDSPSPRGGKTDAEPAKTVRPKASKTVRRTTTIEVYEGVDPTTLRADLLIAALPIGVSRKEQLQAPLHQAIRKATSGWCYTQLEAAGELAPLQTVFADAHYAHAEVAPAFDGVIFINGGQPTADAIDKALVAAADTGFESVVLPVRDFIVFDQGSTEIDTESLIEYIDIICDGRSLKIKTIKLVV